MRYRRATALMTSAACVLLATTPAHAQNAAAPVASQEHPQQQTDNTEVTVTARKRDERLIDVPVVVTVQNQETLARYNATNLTAIGELTPSVIVGTQRGQGGSSIAIRGISSPATQSGFEQAVSVAVDGVQTSNGHIAQLGFFDLQQVETLKGPQALFFGKNNTAGVISVTTAGPTSHFEVTGRASYEFVGREPLIEGTISGPITDTLGARLALQYRHLDGWIYNTAQPLANPFYSAASGAPAGAAQLPGSQIRRAGESEFLGRVTLVYEPVQGVKTTLKVFGSHARDSGPGVVAQNIGPCSGANPRVYGIADPNADCIANNRTTVGDIPVAIAQTFRSINNWNGVPFGDLGAFATSFNASADIGKVNLTSVTGYSWTDYANYSGLDQTDYSQLVVAEDTTQKEFSQELRLNTDLGGPINFMLGGYFQHSIINLRIEDILNDANYNAASGRFASFDAVARQAGSSLSFFGQARWNITPRLELDGGLRWTHEDKYFSKYNLYGISVFNTAAAIYPGSDQVGVLKGRFSDSNVSPEATLTYHVLPNLTAFAAYKTGFKAGGFGLTNPLQVSTRIGDVDYQSERAHGGEIGLRGRALGGKLFFSADAFLYRFSNLQVNVFDPTRISYVINNAGEVKQHGFELEGNYDLSRFFSLRGALAYVHNRFGDYTGQCYGYAFPTGTTRATAVPPPNCSFVNATALTLQQVFDGRAPARSPEFTGNAGFTAGVPMRGGMRAELTGDAFYSDSYYSADTLVGASEQPSFWRLNASVALAGREDRWKLSLIGRNLTNNYYLLYATDRTGGASVPGAIGEQRGIVARGREITVQASVRF